MSNVQFTCPACSAQHKRGYPDPEIDCDLHREILENEAFDVSLGLPAYRGH